MSGRVLVDRTEVRNIRLLISLWVVIALTISSRGLAEETATGALGMMQIPAARPTPKSDRLDQGSCWYAISFVLGGLMRRCAGLSSTHMGG
jgi:hypothetical protein